MISVRLIILSAITVFLIFNCAFPLPPALERVNMFISEVMDTSFSGSPPWIKCALDKRGNACFIYDCNGFGYGLYLNTGIPEIHPGKIEPSLMKRSYEDSYNRIITDDYRNSHLYLTTMYRGDYTLDRFLYVKINGKGEIVSELNIEFEFELVDIGIIDGRLMAFGFSIPGLNKSRDYFLLEFNQEGKKFKKYRIKTKEELHHSSHNASMYILPNKRIMLISTFANYYDYPKWEKYVNKTIIDLKKHKVIKNEVFPLKDSIAAFWPAIDLELDWNENPKMRFQMSDTLGYFSILSKTDSKSNYFTTLLFNENGEIIIPENIITGNVLYDNLSESTKSDIVAKYKGGGRFSGQCPGFMIISFRDFPNLLLDYGNLK